MFIHCFLLHLVQPLIVNTPYLSIWSTTNNLTDSWPEQWTGMIKAICGAIRIDGTPYRFMGPSGTLSDVET